MKRLLSRLSQRCGRQGLMAQRSPRAAAALLLFGTGAAAAYSHRPISCQEASSPCSSTCNCLSLTLSLSLYHRYHRSLSLSVTLVRAECKLDNTLVLAGDIGGTNSRLKLYCVDPQAPSPDAPTSSSCALTIYCVDPQAAILKGEPAPGAVVFEAKYSNIQYKSLEEVTGHTLLPTHSHTPHTHTAASSQPLLPSLYFLSPSCLCAACHPQLFSGG